MLNSEPLRLEGAVLLRPARHHDARGFFLESYRRDRWSEAIGDVTFVQDNHSRSLGKGIVRGLHFQRPPFAQGKLVRVTRGSVVDVIVDAREGSATYAHHVAVELSEENGHQLWVPRGFLHGFCTLTDDVELLYKVDGYYDQKSDGCVAFDDPDLGITWPFPRSELILSDKDRAAPRLRDIRPPFTVQSLSKDLR